VVSSVPTKQLTPSLRAAIKVYQSHRIIHPRYKTTPVLTCNTLSMKISRSERGSSRRGWSARPPNTAASAPQLSKICALLNTKEAAITARPIKRLWEADRRIVISVLSGMSSDRSAGEALNLFALGDVLRAQVTSSIFGGIAYRCKRSSPYYEPLTPN